MAPLAVGWVAPQTGNYCMPCPFDKETAQNQLFTWARKVKSWHYGKDILMRKTFFPFSLIHVLGEATQALFSRPNLILSFLLGYF